MQITSSLSRLLTRFSLPMALMILVSACGSSYRTVTVKDYRLALVSDDQDLKDEFRDLCDSFNQSARMEVLTFVDNPADANSAIIVTKGLEQRDGKVGWGQWLSESREDNPILNTPGSKPERRVEYSMRLEFDEDYIRSRMVAPDLETQRDKEKLFFHEVGHGLEMSHTNSTRDVMYHDISGEKDFAAFFANVRSYMGD